MANAYSDYHVRGTSALGTYATLYNTDAATTAVVSTIAVTNTSASTVTYRIGFDTTAGTPDIANGEWLVYDATVAGNDTVFITIGQTLGNTKYIRVSSSADTVCFHASVSEIS